jgi:DNA repair photolyase
MDARPKAGFRRLLLKDLADLDAFDVPPAPVHLSNSTDAFQDRQERLHRDTLFTLRQLRRYRHRFTTITLLTKNPGLLASEEYLDVLGKLHRPGAPLVVEVSLAFWRDSVARVFDPGGPGVHQRASALARLCGAGVTVVIRVSPTYPIGIDPPGGACPQTPEDMDAIAALAARVGAWRIVYTPAKIVRPRNGPLHPVMQEMLTLYRRLAGERGVEFRAGAWRLPPPAAERYAVRPLRRICRRRGVELVFCKNHLLATR